MMEPDIVKSLEYTIKHTPIQYVVTRNIFWWNVTTLDGKTMCSFFLLKRQAQRYCEFLNAVFNVGYAMGCNAIVKTIL